MAVRTLAGLSQRDLRDQVGVGQSVVSRIENGKAAPSKEVFTAWVTATGAMLGIDLDPWVGASLLALRFPQVMGLASR